MNQRQANYSTKSALSAILRIMLILVIGLAIYAVWTVSDGPKQWDVEFPMVNAGIDWDGAGYNGALEARE